MASEQGRRIVRRRTRRQVITWTTVAATISLLAAALPYLEIRGVAAIPVLQALVPLGAVALLVFGIPTLTPIREAQMCEAGTPLTVLSFNAKLSGADPAALSELIRATRPDAVVLLETNETLIDAVRIQNDLADALPYRTREVTQGQASGSVILSAHPLSLEENVPGSEFDQVSAVATMPGDVDVRLAAAHPPPPVWQPNGWLRGLDDMAAWVDQTSDDRLIVAGDFNASFAHPALRRLASGLRSGAEAAGPVPWPTWPEGRLVPAFTAIDHVFARDAAPSDWHSYAVDGSDHRAVVARWALCA